MNLRMSLGEAIVKEGAVKYFPDFFEKSYTVLGSDVRLLKEKYLTYCENYFDGTIDLSLQDRELIRKAYLYLKDIMQNRSSVYAAKSKITGDLLKAYDALVSEIANYSFCGHRSQSYGAIQNQTNKKILFEISLMRPVLLTMLENFDAYYVNMETTTDVEYQDIQMVRQLEKLVYKLTISKEYLENDRGFYYNAWDSVNGKCYYSSRVRVFALTKRDLGRYRNSWRRARNEACVAILNFYKEIKEVHSLIPMQYKVHEEQQVNDLYNENLQSIIGGPNYYNYLTEDERMAVTEQNILRKKALKRM